MDRRRPVWLGATADVVGDRALRARSARASPCEPASSESVVGASSTRPGNDETDSTRADGSPALDESGQADSELRLLQGLLPAVAALDLETILARGLRAAAEAGNASASVILLARGGGRSSRVWG